MRAIILKEVRQLVYFGGFAAVSVSGLLAFGLYANNAMGLSLVDRSFQLIAAVVFATVGLGLGLVVVLPDLRRGHFGFAVHRPVPRTKLFLGKFVATLLVYGVATSVAVLVASWCATNSRFVKAPFHISMLLPLIYFQAAGVVWIACGMLVATRQARWFGSRTFPIATTVVFSILGSMLTIHFYEAIAVAGGSTAVLLAVGAMYFKHNGGFAPQPLWTRVLSGLVMLGSIGVIVGLGVTVATESVAMLVGRPGYSGINVEYAIDDDGVPYRVDRTGGGQVYQDVDGRPIPPVSLPKRFQPGASLVAVDFDHPGLNRAYAVFYNSFLNPSNYLDPLRTNYNSERWTFVVPKRVLEAFNYDGEPLGQLGADGVLGQAAKPFEAGSRYQAFSGVQGMPLIISNSAVYTVQPGERRVRRVLETDASHRLIAATTSDYRYDEVGEFKTPRPFIGRRVMAVADDRLYLRSLDEGGATRVVDLPPLGEMANLNVKLLNDDAVAVLLDRYYNGNVPAMLVIQRNGRTTQQELPKLPHGTFEPFWTDAIPLTVSPPAAFGLMFLLDPSDVELVRYGTAALLGGGLFAVLLTAWLTRGYRLLILQRGVWIGMSMLLGLAVPLTLLCLRERSGRVRCANCAKKRPVNEDRCPHCGADWPAPGDAATNVFDDRAAA